MTSFSAETLLSNPLARLSAGARAIGHVGLDVPLEVLVATGATVLHLPWDRVSATPNADRWMESGFAPWARRILEDWTEGRFDDFEQVVFSRGDDSAQRLYYYICELQRRGEIKGPEAIIFDVAYIRRPTSQARTVVAVENLCTKLGVEVGELAPAIVALNARRAALMALQTGRSGAGPAFERLTRASLFGADIATLSAVSAASVRLLLAGTPPPDDRLHVAAEGGGASIVAEAHDRSMAWMGPLVSTAGDPVRAIAAQVHDRPRGARTFGDRGQRLVEAARAAQADGVVLWLIEEDESEAWHVPAQRDALIQARIPHLIMTRRSWSDDAPAQLAVFVGEVAV